MTIQEMLEKSGLNVSQFSKEYGIPYRTLQHWLLGDRIPPQWVLDLLERDIVCSTFSVWVPDNSKDPPAEVIYTGKRYPTFIPWYSGKTHVLTVDDIFALFKKRTKSHVKKNDAIIVIEKSNVLKEGRYRHSIYMKTWFWTDK